MRKSVVLQFRQKYNKYHLWTGASDYEHEIHWQGAICIKGWTACMIDR
jgi:hypothetical protein